MPPPLRVLLAVRRLGARIAAGSFVLTLLCTAAQAQLEVHNPKKLKYPAARAEAIFVNACESVRREYGFAHAAFPRLVVNVGTHELFYNIIDGVLDLPEWNDGYFAQAVVIAAFRSHLTEGDQLRLAKRALTMAASSVDVSSLQKAENRSSPAAIPGRK